jgi:hypothetical protein
MDETKRDRFLRVLSKLEKQIPLKDPNGDEYIIKIGYPTWRNSDKFWDIIYETMQVSKGEDKEQELSKAESITFIRSVTPKVIGYITEYMELKNNEPLSEEEKEYIYIIIQLNINSIFTTFLEMATNMFGHTGDVPKNLKESVPSKTE